MSFSRCVIVVDGPPFPYMYGLRRPPVVSDFPTGCAASFSSSLVRLGRTLPGSPASMKQSYFWSFVRKMREREDLHPFTQLSRWHPKIRDYTPGISRTLPSSGSHLAA